MEPLNRTDQVKHKNSTCQEKYLGDIMNFRGLDGFVMNKLHFGTRLSQYPKNICKV